MYFLIGFICGAIAALIYFKIQSRQIYKGICRDKAGAIYYFPSKYYNLVLADDKYFTIQDDILLPYSHYWATKHQFMGHVDQQFAPKEYWRKHARALPRSVFKSKTD